MSDTATANPSVRLVAEIDPDLLDQIDRYWHKQRLPSRTAAVRELLNLALDIDKLGG